MPASNAALKLDDTPPQPKLETRGNPNWRKGLPTANPHGRPPLKGRYASFMELRIALKRIMKERHAVEDYDAVVAIAEMGCDLATPLELRFRCHAEVAAYTYPTLKQVEVTGKDGGAIEVKQPVVDSLLGLLMNGGTLPTVLDAVVRSEMAEVIEEEAGVENKS